MSAGGALLVCTGGGIGDVLLATPVAAALRARHGRVVGLTVAAHASVLAACPDVDEVWTLPPGRRAFVRTVRRIARARFAAAIVTWATLGSALLPALGRVPVRVGQARRSYSGLFTHRVVVRSERGDRTTHWTEILLDFARAIGCDAPPWPRFVVGSADEEEARALLARHGVRGAYALVHPTRGIASARSRWPTERLGELVAALAAHLGVPVLLSGSAADRPIAEAVAAAARAVVAERAATFPVVAGEASLGAFGALARGARVVVALDSGPMHVAAAVGAPTVGIFALQSDEPDRWAPRGPRTAVVRATYPCPPSHRKETCPDFACLRALDVAAVLARVDGLLRA